MEQPGRPDAPASQPTSQPVSLPMPTIGPASMGVLGGHAPKPIKVVLNWGRRYSLWVFNFGLACCAIEFIATSMGRHDFMRLGVIPFASSFCKTKASTGVFAHEACLFSGMAGFTTGR